jgi:ribosomal protein S18 acetylase RimI-like enzyme
MSLLYRSVEEKDLEALQALALASYSRLIKYITPANWTKMQGVIMSEDKFPHLIKKCFGFVCEDHGRLLGTAFLVPSGNPTKIYSKETSYIRMVGVDPESGGKGIAQSLTRLCMDKAAETGERTISLHSAEVMHAARHIYEKLGFQKIRLLEEHYGLPYWLYQFEIP